MSQLIPMGVIERRIFFIRDRNVMIDRDLAQLYGVSTKVLNQAVKRNMERFPDDFMFQLSKEEETLLRSQIVTSKKGKGGRRYLPYAFSEQGVAMLSSVLKSKRAIDVNIAIMRAFVRLREFLASHKELARKLRAMEQKYDSQIKAVVDAIQQLTSPASGGKRKIGFIPEEREK